MTPAPASGSSDPPDDDPIEPAYPSVELWVLDIFTTTWCRRGAARWCAKWWEHAEAIVILSSMWRSWEGVQLDDDPGAMIAWLTRDFYPALHELTSQAGPFAACTPERHNAPEILAVEPAPQGYWPTT